jgi:GntR family transcriptional regulator
MCRPPSETSPFPCRACGWVRVLVHKGTRAAIPSSDFAFSIHIGSTEPIYRQLVEHVRRRVASGQIKAGEEVPSVRKLAQLLAVHPMTLSKAYSLLEAEGLLERRRGLAMRVAPQHQHPQPDAVRIELLRPTLARAAAEARQLELPKQAALDLFDKIIDEGGIP